MNRIIYLYAILSICIVQAQDQYSFGERVSSESRYIEIRGIYDNIDNNDSPKEKVMGSPYLFEDWKTNGEIISVENKTYKIKGLNYNAYSDRFMAKTSADSLFIFEPAYLLEVTINNRLFKKFLNKETGLFNYYEIVISSGEIELLKRNQKVVRTGVTNRLTMEKESDYLILKENYFLKKNENLAPFSLKKKNILKLFGDKSRTMNKFISENKLSVKEEIDLKRIFEYFESL